MAIFQMENRLVEGDFGVRGYAHTYRAIIPGVCRIPLSVESAKAINDRQMPVEFRHMTPKEAALPVAEYLFPEGVGEGYYDVPLAVGGNVVAICHQMRCPWQWSGAWSGHDFREVR
jgi:hypothetical protein